MKLLYVLAACALLQACGGGGGEPPADEPLPPAACSVDEQRQTLRDFLDQQYYWYPQLVAPNAGAATLDAYFQSMLNRPLDRYSYTQPTAAFDQIFVEGTRTGYGYSLVWADAAQTTLRVRFVEPLSPAARAGLQRGDTILAIDGVSPADIVAGRLPVVTAPGVERSFTLRSGADSSRVLKVVSEEYSLKPVSATRTFEATRAGLPVKVGYVAYSQFVNYSMSDLQTAFAQFAGLGVGEVILDLRYNGGGSINVSRDLASMVGGSRTAGQMYAYLRFNDKQTGSNRRIGFNTAEMPFALPLEGGLERVFVITSDNTASASELLINGLRPFMDVVLIGETTYGKPFGFVPRNSCGTTYNAVQFESLNSAGFGDYTAGFTPTCEVADDLDHQLGDAGERRIRAALDFVATGRCSAEAPQRLGARKARATEAFGETYPKQMFAD